MSSKLDVILADAEVALGVIAGLGILSPGSAAAAALAERVLSVIQQGVEAHEAITGQPLDLTKLHHIEAIP